MDYFMAALRNELRVSGVPKRLALDTGLSESYLSQLKHGKKNNPSRDVIAKICGALGVSFNEMVQKGRGTTTPAPDSDRQRLHALLDQILTHGSDAQKQLVKLAIEGATHLGTHYGHAGHVEKPPGEPGHPAPLRRGTRGRKAI
jgi:transcriptional regulator with XRE-family HTH domain